MFVPIDKKNTTVYEMVANPYSIFVSSSADGILSGNLSFDDFDSDSISNLELDRVDGNYYSANEVKKDFNIQAMKPHFEYSETGSMLDMAKNVLMPFYRVTSPSMNFGYTNYNCINFQSESMTDNNFALVYGDYTANGDKFHLSNSFTIEFWIKPKRVIDRPGTVLHYSGNFAISLDNDTAFNTHRPYLIFQFGSGTWQDPGNINTGSQFVVTSSKRYLTYDRWAHVSVRWSDTYNKTTGTIFFDGRKDKDFIMDFYNLNPSIYETRQLFVGNFYSGSSGTMYFKSPSKGRSYLPYDISLGEGFRFLDGASLADVEEVSEYLNFPLNAELCDIRIWKSWRTVNQIRENMGTGLSKETVSDPEKNNLSFYVPCLFAPQPRKKKIDFSLNGTYWDNDNLGMNYLKSDCNPFNATLAFNTNVLKFNNENYLVDFAEAMRASGTNNARIFGRSGSPRMHKLTSSTMFGTGGVSDDIYEYDDFDDPHGNSHIEYRGGVDQKILNSDSDILNSRLILPNDNGNFVPNWRLLELLNYHSEDQEISGSGYVWLKEGIPAGWKFSRNNEKTFITDIGTFDTSFVSLRNLLIHPWYSNKKLNYINYPTWHVEQTNFLSPYKPTRQLDSLYVARQRMSFDSIWVNLLSIPKIYYGSRIKPGTFRVIDKLISSSQITVIRDDERGGLYRAESENPSTFNYVGSIFYAEGLAIITNPHLYRMFEDKCQIEFLGEQSIFVQTLNLKIPKSQLSLPSDGKLNVVTGSMIGDRTSVIVDGVNVHDRNFNIVARAKLAQPIEIQENDPVMFKLKMDF